MVFDYQGQPGINFQAYFGVQATQNLYGGIAPCSDTTTRPEVSGITCGIAALPPDSTPPTTPGGLTATALSSSRINLSWTTSSDPESGIAGYDVERCQGTSCSNFTPLGSTAGVSYSDNNVNPNATYRYRVRARNGATIALFSSYSNNASASSPGIALLSEENTDHAIVLDSVTLVRDPISVWTIHNFSPDQRRRVTIFALNFDSQSAPSISDITAQAVGPQTFSIPVEAVTKTPGFDWLTQITLRLPDEMRNAGTVQIAINYRGVLSNTVTVVIASDGPLAIHRFHRFHRRN
jgi:hypothetical protein